MFDGGAEPIGNRTTAVGGEINLSSYGWRHDERKTFRETTEGNSFSGPIPTGALKVGLGFETNDYGYSITIGADVGMMVKVSDDVLLDAISITYAESEYVDAFNGGNKELLNVREIVEVQTNDGHSGYIGVLYNSRTSTGLLVFRGHGAVIWETQDYIEGRKSIGVNGENDVILEWWKNDQLRKEDD